MITRDNAIIFNNLDDVEVAGMMLKDQVAEYKESLERGEPNVDGDGVRVPHTLEVMGHEWYVLKDEIDDTKSKPISMKITDKTVVFDTLSDAERMGVVLEDQAHDYWAFTDDADELCHTFKCYGNTFYVLTIPSMYSKRAEDEA